MIRLLALALLGGSAAAAEPAVELKAPAAAVMIGTPVELEGTATTPAGATLSFDPTAQATGAVTALEARFAEPSVEGGTKRQAVKLTVAAFELGMVDLPPLAWTLKSSDGSLATVKSAPVRFESVGPPSAQAEGQDIRDIRGPLSPPWWLYAAPVALILAAACGLWAWWRRSRGEGGPASTATVDTRQPHERALDELRALHSAEVPVKEFYIRMTDILRRYFEGRFGVDAAVLTTGDLLKRLREAELDRPVVARCREVFEHADLVKFARWVPATPEIRKDWGEAERVVLETKPPEPQPASVPATQP